jgi:NAD(P)-dependent dehydrogenase (short-subunit alcohol dehydrogenase family)
MSGVLSGRSAIITGANQGLGLSIAHAYAAAGARLVICARDAAKLEEAVTDLRRAPGVEVIAEAGDVSREGDVERIVARALKEFGNVEILVNNAGIYGPLGPIDEIDWSDWVRAIEINLFGSVLMCRALLPHFRDRRYGKIVQLSGGGATNPLPRISAYAASKAAVVRFAETLAEEVREDRIDVNSIAPGALNTRLLDEVLEAGPGRVGESFYARALKQKEEGGSPLDRGAALAVFLASAASDGITGKLLSAIWDPWDELPEHADDLRQDIYTLRRIVPKDRGLKWGDR